MRLGDRVDLDDGMQTHFILRMLTARLKCTCRLRNALIVIYTEWGERQWLEGWTTLQKLVRTHTRNDAQV
jgi:hypothetical protein